MGFTCLISRILSGKDLHISHYDEEFVEANINKSNKSTNPSEKKELPAQPLVQIWKFPVTQSYVITLQRQY